MQESVGPVLNGASSLMEKEVENVKVLGAFVALFYWQRLLPGTQVPVPSGKIWGRKYYPPPRKRELRTI